MNQNQLRDDTEPRSVDQQRACSPFRVGDRIRFWHTHRRRLSGVIYAETPAHINSGGIPVAQQVSVTVRFGRNHVCLGVDVDYCRAVKAGSANDKVLIPWYKSHKVRK